MTTPLRDQLQRPLRDLRVSVTDRCNFRCTYCMPKEVFGRGYSFLPKGEILSFEEITRLARIFIAAGVEKIRLTGGEPLLRRDLDQLVAMLAPLPGLRDLTLTTNGSLLAALAVRLHAAGLHRITVSLDSLDEQTFARMNDVDFPLATVLRGIEAARLAGYAPIKINMVVKRGMNEHEIPAMAQRFRGPGYNLRFIEYMDVGNTNGWRREHVVPADEIIARASDAIPLEELPPRYSGEVARRFRDASTGSEIGVISSVTQPFCGDCTRARLAADGQLYTCLFASRGSDLRNLLRGGASDEQLGQAVRGIWSARSDRYSEIRSADTTASRKVEMAHIGG